MSGWLSAAMQRLHQSSAGPTLESAMSAGRENYELTEGRDRRAACAMVIMAKASIPGACKTRLVPPLTLDEAATVNTRFLQDVAGKIGEASRAVPIEGYATCTPAGSDAFFQTVLPPAFKLVHPPVLGLGLALAYSSRTLLEAGYGAVCLLNSDSPDLPAEVLVEAAQTLSGGANRLVLGPADDGGYYLIGMNRWHARLFEDIAWSTEVVATQTVERAREVGLQVHMLRPWHDIDDLEALEGLATQLLDAGGAAAAPRAAAVLRELRAAGRIAASSSQEHAG
jgi:rSAM/selenodomain-associated transferase 1